MLPFPYPCSAFQDTWALRDFQERQQRPKVSKREIVGDHLGEQKAATRSRPNAWSPPELYPCFSSLFQGDHLGVELALRSHSLLLENHGLLQPHQRLLGNTPVPPGPVWDALVIDDYFAISSERLSDLAEDGFSLRSLEKARDVYTAEGLLGSPEKDVVAATEFKAAGAEVRSGIENARRGIIPVGAPLAKRIALSVVSLRAARLGGISSGLASRLAGNWVSVLQYRKCFSSLIDDFFRLSSSCLSEPEPQVYPLPRAAAQEIVSLAAIAPLIFSNVAVDYHPEAFATDASNQKGAIVATRLSPTEHEIVWLSADRKGSYTHLDNEFRAVLRQVGEVDDDAEAACPKFCEEPIQKQPLMYFDFVEVCGGAGKVTNALRDLGHSVAPVLDLSNSSHYDLSSLRLLEWIIYMIEENQFRSFLIAPPCTSFSPAAHPAVRSYKQPLGFDRLNPKTFWGNLLAFRALLLMRVGKKHHRPCGLEQSRLSKMCWLQLWTCLRERGFSEAVIASCVFGSIHRKEFRLLCYLLDVEFLDRRCPGGHSHVRVEGSYTKASATYVDGLAWHIGLGFHKALRALDAAESLSPNTVGLESVLANDIMVASKWLTVRAWFWKKASHINVLELASAVSNLGSVAKQSSSVRFASFVDSAVCRGALAKGRSASFALQPMLKRACAFCIAADLYPSWIFSPTRLNVADDPSRECDPREAVKWSISKLGGLSVLAALTKGLRRYAANWVRLCLLALLVSSSSASTLDSIPGLPRTDLLTYWSYGVLWTFAVSVAFVLFSIACPVRVGKCKVNSLRNFQPLRKPARVAMVLCLLVCQASAMNMFPQTDTERQRVCRRDGVTLIATRAIKKQTRDRRRTYLDWFRRWLWDQKQVSFKYLIDQKPPDPEKLASFLVEYGKELYRAGKAYGVYAETINSVAVERPLIRRQLMSAWDLAFAWLADEPHAHHPAMPLSLMAAMVVIALHWGWPYEASVILMAWTGVMRIGEVLAARRKDLILPCEAAPGTSFMLIIVHQPKTRGRAANHQAARIDQEDVIRFLSAMYKDAPQDSAVWPFSAATLRKRFSQLLRALELPTSKAGGHHPFDLGSMRPGGATWLLHQTENPEYVRRRGRWLSSRVLEVYIQEVLVTTFIERLSPRTRFLIEPCSGEFAITVERTIAFLDSGIPPRAWFTLLSTAAVFPPEKDDKVGSDGDNCHAWNIPSQWRDDEPSQQKSKKKEGAIPVFRKATGGFCDAQASHHARALFLNREFK